MTGVINGRWSDPVMGVENRRSSQKRRRGNFSPLHSSGLSEGGDFEMIFESNNFNHHSAAA
jgi:hypothetical protein